MFVPFQQPMWEVDASEASTMDDRVDRATGEIADVPEAGLPDAGPSGFGSSAELP